MVEWLASISGIPWLLCFCIHFIMLCIVRSGVIRLLKNRSHGIRFGVSFARINLSIMIWWQKCNEILFIFLCRAIVVRVIQFVLLCCAGECMYFACRTGISHSTVFWWMNSEQIYIQFNFWYVLEETIDQASGEASIQHQRRCVIAKCETRNFQSSHAIWCAHHHWRNPANWYEVSSCGMRVSCVLILLLLELFCFYLHCVILFIDGSGLLFVHYYIHSVWPNFEIIHGNITSQHWIYIIISFDDW